MAIDMHAHAHPGAGVARRWDPGTPVFDSAGAWVGIVSLYDVPGSYLRVQKGRLFPRDVYIPAHLIDIDQGDATGVHLRLSKGDLRRGGCGAPSQSASGDGPDARPADAS